MFKCNGLRRDVKPRIPPLAKFFVRCNGNVGTDVIHFCTRCPIHNVNRSIQGGAAGHMCCITAGHIDGAHSFVVVRMPGVHKIHTTGNKQLMPGCSQQQHHSVVHGVRDKQRTMHGDQQVQHFGSIQFCHVLLEPFHLFCNGVLRRQHNEMHGALRERVPHFTSRIQMGKSFRSDHATFSTRIAPVRCSKYIFMAVNFVVADTYHQWHLCCQRLDQIKVALPNPTPPPSIRYITVQQHKFIRRSVCIGQNPSHDLIGTVDRWIVVGGTALFPRLDGSNPHVCDC